MLSDLVSILHGQPRMLRARGTFQKDRSGHEVRWPIPGLVTAMLAFLSSGCFLVRRSWMVAGMGSLAGQGGGHSETIMWQLRLPRSGAAALSGAALGLSGLLMQTFSAIRWPAQGFGCLSGATLGVALVALGGQYGGRDATGHGASSLGALIGGGAVMAAGAGHGAVRSRTALAHFRIDGGLLGGALVTVLQAGAEAGALQAFVHWGMGSLPMEGGHLCPSWYAL